MHEALEVQLPDGVEQLEEDGLDFLQLQLEVAFLVGNQLAASVQVGDDVYFLIVLEDVV